jgi:hypothetical protein
MERIMEVKEPMPNRIWHSEEVSQPACKDEQRKMALTRLKGCITLPDDFDYKKEISDAILEKYEKL